MFSWRQLFFKKLHSSWLIAFLSVGIIVGVALGLVFKTTFADWSWIVSAIGIIASVFIFKRAWMIGLVIVAGIIFGLWRGGQEQVGLLAYKNYFSKPVSVGGKISQDVAAGKNGQTQIELEQVKINGERVSGKVWLSALTHEQLQRSDQIVTSGKLKPGFGGFAASMSFAKVVSAHKGSDEARDVRDWFAEKLRRAISEPEASLGLGFLVGQRSSLPVELDQQLRIVGLSHIVVASGYNLTILVRAARRLFKDISKYLTTASALSMITGFILITGFSPSMTRAGLVTALSLAAWYYGRKISPFVLLPLAAAVTLLVNPSYAWGDVGWYLSFSAFSGVMILAPLLQHYFFGPKKPGFFRQVLGETVAALLVTAPIIMLVFGQYSPYALLSNLVVVPIIPYIMMAVFVVGLVSAFIPALSLAASLPASGLLHYVTSVVQWIAALPGAQTELQTNTLIAGGYYLLLVGVGVYLWQKTKHNFYNDNLIE